MWTTDEKKIVANMVYKYHRELTNSGFPLYPVTRIYYAEGVGYLGKCNRNLETNEVTIGINRAVLEVPGKLMNTVLHELCHAMRGAKSHGTVWQAYAKAVSLQYNTTIQQYAPDYAAAVIESKRKYNHKLTCEYCDRSWKYSRAGKIVKYIQNHRVRCVCGKGYLHYSRIS